MHGHPHFKGHSFNGGHCLNATNEEVIYFVKTSAGGTKTQTYKVVDMAVHEGYQKLSGPTGAISVHDIALVKLDRAIVGGIPAQLPKKSWVPSSVDSVLVAGYGENGLPAKSKEELLKDPRVIALQQEIKNNPQMSEADQMRIYGELFNIASEKPLLWTRSKAKMVNKEGSPMKLMQLSGGQSVCSGDSGGPSFARSANSGLMVVGVHSTSTNADCGSSGSLFWKRDLPGYDTFVPYYIDWIQSSAAKLRK